VPEGGADIEVKPKHRLRSAYRAITAAAFVAFFAANGVYQYFALTRPKRADPASGRIFVLVNHGTVYVTRTEQHILLALFGAAIAGVLVAVALRVMHEGLHYNRGPGSTQ
jgi:hypothetical protein